MSYYILPKNNNNIIINPTHIKINNMLPYLSCTLLNYFNELKTQIISMCLTSNDLSFNTYEDIVKIINPYEYIFSKVPGSKFSVSKLKCKTNIFYDFLEIAFSTSILDTFKNKNIRSLNISHNLNDIVDCFDILREGFTDNLIKYNIINYENIDGLKEHTFDFLFFEADKENVNNYILNLMLILAFIFKNMNSEGVAIIKISHIFYKPVVDIIYILTTLFERVYLIKPSTSNVTTFDKYIVCKNFIKNEKNIIQYNLNYHKLMTTVNNLQNNYITSILDYDTPYYFITKLEDINITIGQQQLESLDMIINIFRNKNKSDKIETIKNINIQKSINWCEKYKIPCNKFIDKCNIFLPIYKEKDDKFIDFL